LPHCYGNSHATWDHTVLPATRQRWHSRPYPSRSWYSIKRPQRDARLSWPSCVNSSWNSSVNSLGHLFDAVVPAAGPQLCAWAAVDGAAAAESTQRPADGRQWNTRPVHRAAPWTPHRQGTCTPAPCDRILRLWKCSKKCWVRCGQGLAGSKTLHLQNAPVLT